MHPQVLGCGVGTELLCRLLEHAPACPPLGTPLGILHFKFPQGNKHEKDSFTPETQLHEQSPLAPSVTAETRPGCENDTVTLHNGTVLTGLLFSSFYQQISGRPISRASKKTTDCIFLVKR